MNYNPEKVKEVLRPFTTDVRVEDGNIFYAVFPTLAEAMEQAYPVQLTVAEQLDLEAHALCVSVANDMELERL